MARSTEQLLPGMIPPKEEPAEAVDFFGILDSVKPETLPEDVLTVFARRDCIITEADREERKDPKDWCSMAPVRPAGERLEMAERMCCRAEEELREKVLKYRTGVRNGYKNARTALIRAIGLKVNTWYVRREYESLTEQERTEQAERFAAWEAYAKARWAREEELAGLWDENDGLSGTLCRKVVRVRKGIRRQDGRSFTQREFAKLIGWPVNRYTEAEKCDDAAVDELLEKLIMICHANPYYLYDSMCDADFGEYAGEAVECHDLPAIITGYDSILKWILAGKPREVDWTDEFGD